MRKAGLLTRFRPNAFPVFKDQWQRLCGHGFPYSGNRNSQQRELSPIFTAFPFNPFVCLVLDKTLGTIAENKDTNIMLYLYIKSNKKIEI